MIFLDTSAIYALADSRDPNHRRAVDALGGVLQDGDAVLVHNYVLVEALALLHRRLGRESAMRLASDSQQMETHWVTEEEHRAAETLFAGRTRNGVSFVDCTSFVVMRRRGISVALAFDSDFIEAGFSVLP